MAKHSSAIGKDVLSRANGIDRYLNRIERLNGKGLLSDNDAERAYTGGFLEFYAYVERSIEKLFIGLLQGGLRSSDPTVRPRINVSSHAVAHDIVKGHRSYVDWLPYNRYTSRRARAFFAGGRPFDRLANSDIRTLEESTIIRNALAHQSASALRQFKQELVRGKSLPPGQQRPSGYLRGTHTLKQTRMNYYLAQTASVILKLSS